MSYAERIESLRAKHAHLEEELRLENQRPHPDTTIIHRLKREKLRIKDEISRLAHQMH